MAAVQHGSSTKHGTNIIGHRQQHKGQVRTVMFPPVTRGRQRCPRDINNTQVCPIYSLWSVSITELIWQAKSWEQSIQEVGLFCCCSFLFNAFTVSIDLGIKLQFLCLPLELNINIVWHVSRNFTDTILIFLSACFDCVWAYGFL